MLSNAYFLAKFRFGTAENEPAKNLQNFFEIANFAKAALRRTAAQVDLEPQMAAGLVFLVVMGTLTAGLCVYFGAEEASGVGEGTAYADNADYSMQGA